MSEQEKGIVNSGSYVVLPQCTAYVRHNQTKMFEHRKFGPKQQDHPTVNHLCIACGTPMHAGQFTTLIPLGPGGDINARERARSGHWYNAVSIELHYECATGGGDAKLE